MENLGVIPVFVAVVETGGFSPAARKLGISKSAVSKRIGQLEDRLGVRLLYRTTRRLSLTEAGERYFENAMKALTYANEAEDSVTQLQAKPKGRLRINTPMSFGRLHISPLIPKFHHIYPEIDVDLVMDDRIVDLVAEGFDIAIRVGSLTDSTLIARKLAPMRSVICASPEYIDQYGMPTSPSDLLEHNCLLFSYSANEWTFLGQGGPTSVRVSGTFQVNNSEAIREALLQGMGLARIPTFVVGPDLAEQRLIPLLSDYQMPEKTLYAVFAKRQHLPPKVRVFIDFIVENIGSDIPYWERSTQKVS